MQQNSQSSSSTSSSTDMKSPASNMGSGNIASRASSLADQAMAAAKPVATQFVDNYENAREYAVEAYDSTVDYVKANPGKSLAIALGAGLVAGFLLRSRRPTY